MHTGSSLQQGCLRCISMHAGTWQRSSLQPDSIRRGD